MSSHHETTGTIHHTPTSAVHVICAIEAMTSALLSKEVSNESVVPIPMVGQHILADAHSSKHIACAVCALDPASGVLVSAGHAQPEHASVGKKALRVGARVSATKCLNKVPILDCTG